MYNHNEIEAVKVNATNYYVMMLPILSVSAPNKKGWHRIVFDWGKSLSHPHAMVAFALMRPYERRIDKLLFNDDEYIVSHHISKCRSGRLSMQAYKVGTMQQAGVDIISSFMRVRSER